MLGLPDANPATQVACISKGFTMAIIIFQYLGWWKQARCRATQVGGIALAVLVLSPAVAWAAFPDFRNQAKERAEGDALYQQAYAAYHEGDYAAAERLIEQADKLKPNQADGWNLRGVVLLKEKAYDRAEAAFRHSLECDPDFWAAQFNVAEVPYQRKDYVAARHRFEDLLSQTDRFKDRRKWEIVLYKTFLAYLFSGDEAGARKKLAKLSAAPGTNPVLVYAEAAVAFHRKDNAGAQKMLAAAQGKFPQETNDLFSEPLVQAGWINVLPPAPALLTGAGPASPGGTAAALGAARGVVATPSGVFNDHQPIVIDPKLEAAAADPLPEQGGTVKPVLTKVSGTRVTSLPMPLPAANLSVAAANLPVPAATPATRSKPVGTPTVAVVHPTSSPVPDPSLEHGGLLLE